MKALILAGGRGKRLANLSENSNKCMLRINGRHVIEYSLDNAVDAGVEEIVLVVGYRAEEIINHFGISYRGKTIKYVIQAEQKGLVHAIECAQSAVAGADFMLLLGDEILKKPRHREMIEYFSRNNAFVVCGILKVDDRERIKKTYTLVKDADDIVYRLVEKPHTPLNDYMGTGDCVFRNAIYNYIKFTPLHHERNEKELPDLIQSAIDAGESVRSFFICEDYTNINSKDDIDRDFTVG
ncbi:MAG TPA: nucleotidyl transferase [Elusimicrobia bacterium]|nr:nucleotidyl transferase [Elusimicrobiota bacterium]